MNELEFLQAYWWLLISVLGAALVFLLFVQGGQSMLFFTRDFDSRQLMANSLGRKWELTFTTLVVFGGAFFAAFPLFYSTSFGGAYWLWMSILISFVLQAVSYEYRRKRGNIYGTATYDTFLLINGFFGCILLGVAVGMMFFGGEFEVTRTNILQPGSPVISRWSESRGLETMVRWQCLLLGVAVFFLARTQASLYFLNNIRNNGSFEKKMRFQTLVNGGIFALLFVAWIAVLFFSDGLQAGADGTVSRVPSLYFNNLLEMWWWGILFVGGVVAVLWGIGAGAFTRSRAGIWYCGIGTVIVVICLFAIAGYNATCYLPSLTHPQSSLTLANSSSSLYTLKVMAWVSLFIPVVLLYIIYVWRKMNAGGLNVEEIKDEHSY